jgi:MSHA biogenesis protein MshG
MNMGEIFPPKVTPADLIKFTRSLSSLTKAGVPMNEALKGMLPNMKHLTMAKAADDILGKITAGQTLTTAFGDHPKIFSQFYVSMITIGETTGRLGEIFKQLTIYLERENSSNKKVKSALRYPVMVMVTIIIVMIVVVIFVVPGFATMFAKFNAELPLPTRILIGVSHVITNYWGGLIGLLVVIVYSSKKYLKTKQGRYIWGRTQLKIPVAGNVIHLSIMARFSRLLSIMAGAGIQMIPALNVLAAAMDNAYVERQVLGMRESLERGDTLYHAALAANIFDDLVLQMLKVGQETGTTDEMMHEVADYQDTELDYALEKLSAAIEPIMMAVIGVMVMILALGVFMPMWDLGTVAFKK